MWECVRPSCWISAAFHQRREFPPSSPSLSICVYLGNLIRRLENPGESLAHLCLCANCKHATAGNVSEEPVNQVQKTTLKVGATSQNCLTVGDILFWPSDAHTRSRRKKKKRSPSNWPCLKSVTITTNTPSQAWMSRGQ